MNNRVSHKRWRFAQHNELEYQQQKVKRYAGSMDSIQSLARANSRQVSAYLAQMDRLFTDGLTVEVGSGASGLIWNWPGSERVAIDPLAHFFRTSFDSIQRDGPSIVQARGENIPLPDHCADTVLSDNVLDHVEDPAAYLQECKRILKPGGVMYMTIDVHHPVYWTAGRLYNLLFRLGLVLKVPAFPHHPFHFTVKRVRSLLVQTGFRPVVPLHGGPAAAPRQQPGLKARLVQKFQSMFFKNQRMEAVLEA